MKGEAYFRKSRKMGTPMTVVSLGMSVASQKMKVHIKIFGAR